MLRKKEIEIRALPFALQRQFHEQRTRDRIVVIRMDFSKAKRSIKCDRLVHPIRQRIEPYLPISNLAGRLDHYAHQLSTESRTAKPRPHIQSFHFTGVVAQWSQRDAAGNLIAFSRQQQSSRWRRVSTRQSRDFLSEVLKAEADVERGAILFEERPHRIELARSCGLSKVQSA